MLKTLFTTILLALSSISFAKVLDIQHWQTQAGTPVYFVASPNVPMVNITIAFHAGSVFDEQHAGLAALSNGLLAEGNNKLDAQGFSNAMTALGSEFDVNTNKTLSTVSLQCLKENLTPSLVLFEDALSTPTFSKPAITRIKNQMLTYLNFQAQQAEQVANLKLIEKTFKSTPYAHNTLGSSNSLAAIQRKDITQFYNHYYTQKNAAIFIVGAIDTLTAKRISARLLHALPQGQLKTSPNLKKFTPTESKTAIDFDSNQTYLQSAVLAKPRNLHDKMVLMLSNFILGGSGLTSKLSDVLRDQHHLSYAANSQTKPLSGATLWTITSQSLNAKSAQALALTQNLLKHFNITAKKLAEGKQFLIRSLPIRFTSNESILNTMITLYENDLPLDYFDQFANNIKAISLQDVNTTVQHDWLNTPVVTVSVGGKASCSE